MSLQPVLINGEWVASTSSNTFQATNPATTESLPEVYPVSDWDEIERAIDAADAASKQMRGWPGERFAAFLEAYADGIETRTEALVEAANAETALPRQPIPLDPGSQPSPPRAPRGRGRSCRGSPGPPIRFRNTGGGTATTRGSPMCTITMSAQIIWRVTMITQNTKRLVHNCHCFVDPVSRRQPESLYLLSRNSVPKQ